MEEAVQEGLDDWLNDGRENLRRVLDTITFREAVIERIIETEAYTKAAQALVEANREAEAVDFLIELARQVIPLVRDALLR